MKTFKWILGIAGGVLVLLIVVVAIVAATFDPNQYKPQIVDLVKQKTGRTLAMDGKIGLSFFPRIGAEVERIALSGPKGQGTFAKVDEALFLGGLEKGPFLKAFGADIFFDDQRGHVDSAHRHDVAAGHVPFGVANEKANQS